MKKRFLALALGTLAFGVTLGGVKMGFGHQDALMVKAAAEAARTALTFPDENKATNKVSAYNKTWTAKIGPDTYNIANFNNNTWNKWSSIKCGSKNAASVASIATINPVAEAVGEVSITIKCSDPNKINSAKLLVASDKEFKSILEEHNVALGNTLTAQKTVIENPKGGLFYKYEFDCQQTGSNGIVEVSKVEFFKPTAPATAKITSIKVSASDAFKNNQFKGDEFNVAGLSVKANYDDISVDPTDISLAKVKWVLKEDLSGPAIDFVDANNTILDEVAAKEYFLCAQYETFTSSEAVKLTIKDKVLVSAIEIVLDSTSIESGRSTTAKIVSTVPEDATDKTVNWHVVDGTVASIDSTGKVTGLKTGKTQIFATAKDKGAVESNKVEITVTEYEAKTYHQIVAEQVDYSGTYLLGYKASTAQANVWNGEEGSGNHNPAELAGEVLTGNQNAEVACLVIDPVFKDVTNKKERIGYSVKVIGGPNDGLYITTGGTTKDIKFGTDAVAYSISYNSSTGALIKGSKDYAIRFNSATGSGNNRFRFYPETNQQPVQLYRLDYTADVAVNAKAFADKFVAAPICGTDDNTPANAGEFDKFVTEYSGLSRDVRAYLANGDGKGDASFDAFYAKYKAIMDKRASNTEFYDFLAGKYRPAKTQGVFGINQNITDSTSWTLVGIGAVTIAASASLLFFRRKKSN